MSRFLLLFVSFILTIDSFDTVRIIGLFPEHQNTPSGYLRSNLSGNWATQCIAMFRTAIVLADRYKIYVEDHPINYTIIQTTKDGNGFAALELLCQSITESTESDVVGIVGPTSSTNTRFLGPFAAHIELPLISYAATNAELDDTFTYQTFYRTIPSDVLLAEAIVQLFEYFSWTTCTMILEKDDYGYGGLKILSEVYYSKLSIEEQLIFNPQIDEFHANLKQTLEKSRSRIVLVWANQNSSTRIIQHALDANLLDGPYVWLMTNEVNPKIFQLGRSIHFLKAVKNLWLKKSIDKYPSLTI
jgi:hypothetical protein